VRVSRLYPDLLLVEVAEHDRLAVWQDGGQAWVIDGDGNPIPGAAAAAHADLPLVVGDGADVAASTILKLIAERPRLAARVDALVRVDQRRWDVKLKDGGLIRLPAQDEEAALIQLDGLDARRGLFERGFDLVDLRTAGAVVVRDGGASGGSA
jgi:cell division protein FtsQ